MEPKYYEINESSAKLAHDMASFSDYILGSTTAEYQRQVSAAYEKADNVAAIRPEESEKIYSIVDRFARRLAEYYNRESSIGTQCPSIMIAGCSNFPVRKKEKQVAAWSRNHEFYNETMAILSRLDAIARGKDIIQSSDPDAIQKLRKKLQRLEDAKNTMKSVNAYYRKHKTLDGCTALTFEQMEKLKAAMNSSWRTNPAPFEPYKLSNNNANIRRIKERIKTLEATKTAPESEPEEYEGFRVVENTEAMRLQIMFDDKPSAEVRTVLKSNGFRWAPSQNAWQRQLTENAKSALTRIIDELRNQ